MDVVYTFVASIDKKWKEKYEKYKGTSLKDFNPRYNYCGEIIASLLFLNKNVKNIRKIFIVTDNHTLDISFLPDNFQKKIIFIDHKEIIPDKYLPTFNSLVIETFLWKIRHLSKYFMYLNDDIFINKKINLKNLREKIYASPYNLKYKLNGKYNSKYPIINANLLFKKYYPNKKCYINRKHIPFIINRHICRDVFNMMKTEISKTLNHKFRKNYINGSIRFMTIVGSVSILKGKQRIIPFPQHISIQKKININLNYNKYVYININSLSEDQIDTFYIILKKCGISLKVLDEKINNIKYIIV